MVERLLLADHLCRQVQQVGGVGIGGAVGLAGHVGGGWRYRLGAALVDTNATSAGNGPRIAAVTNAKVGRCCEPLLESSWSA